MNVTRVMAKAAGSGARPAGRRRAAKAQPVHQGAGMGIPDRITPGEAADLFGVDPKTVTTWAAAGNLTVIRTAGGQRRYKLAEVRACSRPRPRPRPQSAGPR